MKHLQRLLLLFFLATAPFVACQRDSVPTADDLSQLDNSISVEEAKALLRLASRNLPTAHARKDDKPAKVKYPNWQKALKKNHGKGDFIEVPVLYNSPWSLAHKGLRRLLFFKKQGKTEGMIMQIVGDQEYLKRTQNKFDGNFTGHVTLYDLNDVFLGGFNFKQGKIDGYVQKVDGELGEWYRQKKNGREDVTCWPVTNCSRTSTTSFVTNPNGNNICGPTSTCQLQTIVTTHCTTGLDCAGWDSWTGYPYGDPTCMWQMDCNQQEPTPPQPEPTAYDDFFNTHSNWFTNEEWQWIRSTSELDPDFIYQYRYWSEVEAYWSENSNDQSLSAGPLTSQDIQNWARGKGLFNGVDAVRGNRRAGKAFERAALKFLDIPSNGYSFTTAVRKEVNENYPPTVIPDGIKEFHFFSSASPPINVHIQGYNFIEVKSVDGTLRLSSNEYQIAGFLDALRQKRSELVQQSKGLADVRFRPKLVLMTTSNTTISAQRASEWGVRLYQMKAFKVNSDFSITPNDLTISFGPFRPLNFSNEPQTDVSLFEMLRRFYVIV